MRTITRFAVVLVCVIACVATAGCSAKGSSDDGSSSSGGGGGGGSGTLTTQYLVIPGAEFVSGTASGAQSNTILRPTVTAPASTTYTLNTTVTWTVDFSVVTEIEVTDIIIYVEELDGYFDYPLTPEEIAAGWVEIDTEVVDAEPSTQICNRDYRGNGTCYEKADEGVTGMDFQAASYDEVEAEFSWTLEVEATLIIESVDEYNDDNSGDDSGDNGGGGTSTSCGGASLGTGCSCTYSLCTSCTIQSCCNSSSCWYVYNGTSYTTGSADWIAQQCVHVCTGY